MKTAGLTAVDNAVVPSEICRIVRNILLVGFDTHPISFETRDRSEIPCSSPQARIVGVRQVDQAGNPAQ